MKKPWAIAATAAVVGAALVFFNVPHKDVDPGFHRPHPAVLAVEGTVVSWHEKPPFKKLQGVALVLHGLNLKPEKMESLIFLLNRAGIDALNVSLHGHGENYPHQEGRDPKEARLNAFRTVTYPLWSSEVQQAYLMVRERGCRKKVKVFLVGYSLGGLLGCDLLVSNPDVRFDRMVLLAPALNVMIESYLLKALMPFPNLIIDSLSPESYRSNDGTPMAGYKALFGALDHFQRHMNPMLNVPTLVLMDREDEFISHDTMREMISGKCLDRWKMVTVCKVPGLADPYAHHLLIDEATLGKAAWREMGDVVLNHLVSTPTGRTAVHLPDK
jgi:alpha-beta hydrolase superfamily lysophospholipase